MKVCIIGATGMLGHMLFSELLQYGLDVYGTVRDVRSYQKIWGHRLTGGINVLDKESLSHVLDTISPSVVINAVGLIRHVPEGRKPLPCIQINAEFPHILWQLCNIRGIRCINYSTDCVFDGKAGRPYVEEDRPTATDIYGLTKFLGEIAGPLALTIRTSIIGPELRGRYSLIEWFLAQKNSVRGFTEAIYTGLPTSEHARVLAEYILPHPELEGLYQVSSSPISKYELLNLVARIYQKEITIIPDNTVQEDKRLSCEAFQARTGYKAPAWPDMIKTMREAHIRSVSQWS